MSVAKEDRNLSIFVAVIAVKLQRLSEAIHAFVKRIKAPVYLLRFDKSAAKPSRCLLTFVSLFRPVLAMLWFEKWPGSL